MTQVNILLVDDHAPNLEALEDALGELDEHLVRAQSGKEALKHLLEEEFAVILLDVQMPEIDGFETARLIRARKKTAKVPIIFLTAFDKDNPQVLKGYSLGAVDYIFKPFSPEILRSKVEVFVDLFRMREELVYQKERERERERHEKMATLGKIGGGIAHELNGPLTGIINLIQFAMSRVPEGDRPHVELTEALGYARRSTRIIQDFLKYSRIHMQETPGQANGDINASVREALKAAAPVLKDADVTVEAQPGDTVRLVNLEESMMQQLVLNLIVNACYAMAGSAQRALQLTTSSDGDEVTLLVRDTGAGMDEATRARMCEPFFSTKPTGTGSGLGLSLCKNLLESVGGRLKVTSTVGVGSTFEVVIPKA